MIKLKKEGDAWKIKPGALKLTRRFMMELGDVAVEGYKERLDHGKGVDSSGNVITLKPLSGLTVTRKGSALPLVDTGGLQDSFQIDKGATTNKRAVVAFMDPQHAMIARVHQTGMTIVPKRAKALMIPIGPSRGKKRSGDAIFRKKVVIPARPHVGISKEDQEAMIDIARSWVAGLLEVK